MDGLIAMFSFVAKEEEFRPHPKILRILNVLREWFGKHKENVAALARGEQVPHPTPGIEKDAVLGVQAQTPLHLLSQVASNNRAQPTVGEAADERITPQDQQQQQQPQQDWTFNTPLPIDYSKRASVNNMTASGYSTEMTGYSDQMGMMDPINGDFGWGNGFEQAMDIALYDMEGLQSSGIDNWFLGDSMAPFDFGGDMSQGQGW
jgi:hypothetical protein